MAIAGLLESYVFGPSGFWNMAPLRYAAKVDPFLFLDCAPMPSTLAQSKERKGSNFAIWQPCLEAAVIARHTHDVELHIAGAADEAAHLNTKTLIKGPPYMTSPNCCIFLDISVSALLYLPVVTKLRFNIDSLALMC